MSKKRIEYFDIAKGIAMLCIIVGHMGMESVNQFVFTFHVPLFFLVSGYFLNDRLSVREYAKIRAKQLMIPYAVTSVILVISGTIASYIWLGTKEGAFFGFLNQVLTALYGSGSPAHMIQFVEGIYAFPIGAIWFLPATWVALVIVRYFMNWKYCGICIVIVAILGYSSSKAFWMPLSIQAGMTAAAFVYLGMLARRHQVMEKKLPSEIFIGTIAIWGFCILFCGKLYWVENTFTNGLTDVAGALAGSYLVLRFSRMLEQRVRFLARPLRFVGENSLVILCAHTVELQVIHWDWIGEIFDVGWTVEMGITFATKVLFCLLIVWLVKVMQSIFRKVAVKNKGNR